MRHLLGLNINFLPQQSNFIQFHTEITVLRYGLGWCLQHHSTYLFMFLAVFINSQSYLTLLDSASNLFSPNAVRTIWSSIGAYLIWLNCTSHWIPNHRYICPNEIANLQTKTAEDITFSSLPQVCLSARNSLYSSMKQITSLIQ